MAQYEAEGTMQWFGTYKDLAQEYLKLKCRHRPPSCNKCGFDKFRGHKRVTICSLNKHLKLIASGCVSQSFEIVENRYVSLTHALFFSSCFEPDFSSAKILQRKNKISFFMRRLSCVVRRGRLGNIGVGTLAFNIFFEEVYDFELEFVEWQGRDLFAADEGGTSDPYLVLSIKALPAPTLESKSQILTRPSATRPIGSSSSQKAVSRGVASSRTPNI